MPDRFNLSMVPGRTSFSLSIFERRQASDVAEKLQKPLAYARGSLSAPRVYCYPMSREREGAVFRRSFSATSSMNIFASLREILCSACLGDPCARAFFAQRRNERDENLGCPRG